MQALEVRQRALEEDLEEGEREKTWLQNELKRTQQLCSEMETRVRMC